MPVTAERPVTRSEFDERMALAKQYWPAAVLNLIAEFRRRTERPQIETENGFGFSDLQKCGLEMATGSVESDESEKRLGKRRSSPEIEKLKRRMAAHDGPPTREEIAEFLVLDAASGLDVSGIVAEVLAGKTVAKSYRPTSAQIARHDDLLINSAGI
jgi:hypothetical protein